MWATPEGVSLGVRVTFWALVRQPVAEGALVAGLGMFDQGYYDKLGFGSGAYSHRVAFDPARLSVKARR